MFERIVVLDGSERAERVIPVVASVEISEKDVADAASYLAALKTAYAKRKVKSQAYPIEERTDNMALPWQETITMLALDKHQQPVFRVQFISGGFNLNLLDEAMAFGLHLLKLEPKVVRVGVYDRPPDALSSEEPLVIITRNDLARTGQPASRDQPSSGPPPRWARALVWLILGSSFPLLSKQHANVES